MGSGTRGGVVEPLGGDAGHRDVRVGMESQLVAIPGDPTDQTGMPFGYVAEGSSCCCPISW